MPSRMEIRSFASAATEGASACLAGRIATNSIACLVACVAACSGSPRRIEPAAPGAQVDAALRIRIAQAEARRGGGIAELAELSKQGAVEVRALALRGLGRIGGASAIALVRAQLADPDPAIAGAAAGALGLAASLDELDPETTAALTAALLEALPRAGSSATRVIESLGRAANASAQPVLAQGLTDAATPIAEASAIALGRHGRRKIALADGVRDALARATSHAEPSVRYAAVYALGREHLPKPPSGGAAAEPAQPDPITASLAARLSDEAAEIRAQAIAALARRGRTGELRRKLMDALLQDPDWRVAAEAARALTAAPDTDAAGEQVVGALAARAQRTSGPDERGAQIAIEALRGIVAAPTAQRVPPPGWIAQLAAGYQPLDGKQLSPIARGWLDCLGQVAIARFTNAADFSAVEACGPAEFPDHLRLPLLARLIETKTSSPAVRRAALGKLLAHKDPRVRAAGLGGLAALWPDGSDADHRASVAALIGAIGASDPMVAGTAVEVAPEIYDALGADGDRSGLDAAIVARATSESDVELSAALFGLIGARKIVPGAAACRAGLTGHAVRARAGADCLAALGEGVPAPAAGPEAPANAEAPPVDVATVIGRSVRWTLATSRGPIEIELRPDAAPWAVAAIVDLTRKGFYDNLEFHRVVPDFVVQGGDPTQSGWGGPGFALPAEPSDGATSAGFVAGGLGIADAGRDSGGSQWFIMHARAPHLDGRYTWFGRVVSGQNLADSLVIGDRVVRATVEVSP